MKYCQNCGAEIQSGAKYCTNCGTKIKSATKINSKKEKGSNSEIKVEAPQKVTKDFSAINKQITLKNSQGKLVNGAWYTAGFFLIIVIIAMMDLSSIPIHPALAFVSFFLFISALIVGFMFRSREKKLQTLISGENLLAQWILTPQQKEKYFNYLFEQESGRNKVILFSISFIAIIVFGIFILVIDEGKLFMLAVLAGLISFLALFAYGMPYYYKNSNKRGDGKILIGAKYAYINGYFHNWDFLLSGLSKVKAIKKPFYGINLVYYYTDRTLEHSEELFIPVNEDIDIGGLITKLKELNN